MIDQLHADLRSADPAAGSDVAAVSLAVRQMASGARRTAASETPAPRPGWKRPRVIFPLGIAGVVMLTGAAVLIPLTLAINGTSVDLDSEIPIAYTTDTGVEVSCRYGLYFGDPAERTAADERLAAFVAKHDWAGIGQRIYDEAIANPFVPGPNDDWEVDNQEIRDQFSFTNATRLVWSEIPATLLDDGQSTGATTDCTGRLH